MKFSSIFSNTSSSSWLSFLVSQPLSFPSECQIMMHLLFLLPLKSPLIPPIFFTICANLVYCVKSSWTSLVDTPDPLATLWILPGCLLKTLAPSVLSSSAGKGHYSHVHTTITHCQSNYISISHIQKNKYKGKPPTRFNRCCHHLLCLPLIFKS